MKPTKRTPYIVYLYIDLTQHYQDRYSEVEVNTVVISYKFLLFNMINE
jgi:hypothetical protein